MEDKKVSPKKFLRARRPERFSDSVAEEAPSLDRTILEYHLDSLTSRRQESPFENFARRIAEREICPNLLPQTGPTGGGDSKVDSETYPVADDLSLGWYLGIGREAASERWAFAFSAKKKWRDKVQSDIAKISKTGRGYQKAFFVTNQFVRDKERAEVEDKLREEYGLDVRILDRTWILDRVFSGGLEEVAIEELGLAPSLRKVVRQGPLDVQREQDLQEIERRIEALLQEGRLGLQLADDCIEAATLARSLERPRIEVDGRFVRAETTSNKFGSLHQQMLVAYEKAWTAFWWYEDYELFNTLYVAAQEKAVESRNIYHLELLSNLWLLMRSLVNWGSLDETSNSLQERTSILKTRLEEVGSDSELTSAALHARTLLLLIKLASLPKVEAPEIFRDLLRIVRRSEGLVGYPLIPTAQILIEIGAAFDDLPAYHELFNEIVEMTSKRQGDTAAARMLLRLGAQRVQANRPYEAIHALGRALSRLFKHESREDVIRALYLCGTAYEKAGLLWAARGAMLAAASIATSELWMYSEVTPAQAASYNRLKWIELQLGRIPHVLALHEVDRIISSVLIEKGYDAEFFSRGELEFDLTLGILFLKASAADLQHLTKLPEVLEKQGLHQSHVALLYALGYEQELPDDFVAVAVEDGSMCEFFLKWRDQPASDDLPAGPWLGEESTTSIIANVLGCLVTVELENTSPCIEVAESTLAALQSLFSTGLLQGIIIREPILKIRVSKRDSEEGFFSFDVKYVEGRLHVEILCSTFNPHSVTVEGQKQLRDSLLDLLVAVLARAAVFAGGKSSLVKLLRDERALERSISFTTSFVVLGNVLGQEPKTRLSKWISPESREYPLIRVHPWDAGSRQAVETGSHIPEPSSVTFGQGDISADVRDPSLAKHTEVKTVSLIREELWNRASWFATAFVMTIDLSEPPALMLVFRNAEPGKAIFTHWLEELDREDREERLRVTIIRGIDARNPFAYRVVVGSHLGRELIKPGIKFAVALSRMQKMEPSSDVNLRRFLDAYASRGSYIFTYGTSKNGSFNQIMPGSAYIEKRELYVREAWQIGEHDEDTVGIREDDDPIIPASQKDSAPVLQLLRKVRQRGRVEPPESE
jgi:hypothetical protein